MSIHDYNPWNGYPISMFFLTVASSILLGFLLGRSFP
jgi:hypothetical protein